MGIQVVRAETEHDYQKALDIRAEVFIQEQGVPVEIEIDQNESISTHVVLYDAEGNAVGTGRIRPYQEGVGKIERIAVRKPVRKFGYGKVIMQALETIGREQGYSKLVLEAQLHAKEFYEKLGYRNLSSEPFYDAGILHVKMEKSLTLD